MRVLFLVLLSLGSSFAAELIYISNDTEEKNLQRLSNKYKQALLIDGNNIYLIPKECQLTRYFGGASQVPVKLIQGPEQTQELVITQEVFEAKDTSAIERKIEVEKSIALIEGKVPKAFLDDKEGRGYGGASEVPLDFTFQKMAAQNSTVETTVEKATQDDNINTAKPSQHLQCELLKDGSGYLIRGAKDARLYVDKISTPIKQTILFH